MAAYEVFLLHSAPRRGTITSTSSGKSTVSRPIRNRFPLLQAVRTTKIALRRRRSRCSTSARSADGSGYLDLGVTLVSPDENLLAYSVDTTGEEVFVLRFRDLRTGTDLDEVVPRSYYRGAWSADSAHFFYTVHDEAYRPHQVWRHRIGTARRRRRPGARGAGRALRADRPRLAQRRGRAAAQREPRHRRGVGDRRPRPGVGAALGRRAAGRACCTAPSTWARSPAPGHQRRRRRVPAGLGTGPGRRPGPHGLDPVRPEDPTERLERVDAFAGHLVLSLCAEAEHRLRVVPADDPAGEGFVVRSRFPGGAVRLARNPTYDVGAVTVVDQALRRAARVVRPRPGLRGRTDVHRGRRRGTIPGGTSPPVSTCPPTAGCPSR